MGCGDCGSGESGASHLGVYGYGLMDLVRGNKRAILVLLPKNGSCWGLHGEWILGFVFCFQLDCMQNFMWGFTISICMNTA